MPKLTTREYEKAMARNKKDRGRFDVDANLLKRLMKDVAAHLTDSGVLLLMSDAHIESYISGDLQDQIISEEYAWNAHLPEEGSFAIHRIGRKQK